jgi:hypothetical protein
MAPFPNLAEQVTVPATPPPARVEVPIGVPAYHLYQPPPIYKPLRPIRGLGNAAIALAVIVQLAGCGFLFYVSASESRLVETIAPLARDQSWMADPNMLERPEVKAFSDALTPLFAALGLALLSCVVCVVVFLCWLFRARANAEALAPFEHRRHKAWIIFGWFVPPVLLWFPKQIVDDVWQTSDPAIRQRDPMIRTRSRAIVIVWWLCWLATLTCALLPQFVTLSPTIQWQLLVAGTVVGVVGTVLGVIIVWAISNLQERQRERKLVDSVH